LSRWCCQAARGGSVVVCSEPVVVLSTSCRGPHRFYNMAVALRLRGRLDADALGCGRWSMWWAAIESLRTLFAAPEGIPRQLVVPPSGPTLAGDVVDAAAGRQPAG